MTRAAWILVATLLVAPLVIVLAAALPNLIVGYIISTLVVVIGLELVHKMEK